MKTRFHFIRAKSNQKASSPALLARGIRPLDEFHLSALGPERTLFI